MDWIAEHSKKLNRVRNMKALIIYVSIYQANTQKIAKVMAEALNATLLEPEDVDINTLQDYDLIGLGSGIYWGRFYKRLRNFIKKLPLLQDNKVFLFGTNGHGEMPYKPMEKLLQKKGCVVVGKFSCLGYNTFFLSRFLGRVNEGKPDTNDYERARKFAESLKG
jgi:flavodoxin